MLFALPECANSTSGLVRLWLHEAERVYHDKLTDQADMETYFKVAKDTVKKNFEVSEMPNAYRYSDASFIQTTLIWIIHLSRHLFVSMTHLSGQSAWEQRCLDKWGFTVYV